MKTMIKTAVFLLLVGSITQGQLQSSGIRPNALDASRQVGSGGYNAPSQSYNYGGGFGNLYITGNVTGGKGFRGYVPYSDPTQFRSRLGSSTLSGFESDATNVRRVEQGYLPGQSLPFYNSSSTILPLSAQTQGLTLPGSLTPRTQVLPRPESYGTRALLSPYSTEGYTQLPANVRPSDVLIPNIMLARPQVESPTALPSSATPTPSPKLEKPFAEETAPKEKPSERESSNLMLGQPQPESTTGQEAPQDYSNWVTLQAEKAEKPQGVGTLVPQAEYAEQAKRLGVQGKLRSSSQITEPAPDSKQSETPETPKAKRPSELKSEQPVISSLVGSGTDAFSQTMRLGQRLLAQGKFYEAYQAYVQSLTIKPNDPMPLFGQANALIGAGDLRSGATQLAAAINKFPKFLRLSLDGARLMGSQSILDRRREQVENLARKNKDPQILLLQGYLELLSGSRNAGFQHLSQSGLVTIE